MRKFIVSVVVALVVLCGASFYVFKINDVSKTYENNETKEVNNNMLSMMLETSPGSGEYQKTSASAWPTEGYVFNENLSKCEKGSSLSWDELNNKIIMEGNSADKCYIYFDVAPDPVYFVDYIKNLYTSQGKNNLYYHDSTLEYGAGDNSYRYAGSSDTTNNFVCFGTTNTNCSDDNLYRIIGIFDNKIKLIKSDYATSDLLGLDGLYASASSASDNYFWGLNSSWENSDLNLVNLNTNYLNNIGEKWSSKISTNKWQIGGNIYGRIVEQIPQTIYNSEIVSPSKSTYYDAKIALMYINDYGFAASKEFWKTQVVDFKNDEIKLSNWMFISKKEGVLTIDPRYSNQGYCINTDGGLYGTNVYGYFYIRPAFYLNSDVKYVNGNGSKSNPFRIK